MSKPRLISSNSISEFQHLLNEAYQLGYSGDTLIVTPLQHPYHSVKYKTNESEMCGCTYTLLCFKPE